MPKLIAWLLAHRRWVVSSVLLVSFGLGVVGLRLRLEFHYADLLPRSHPFIDTHAQYHRNFSEANVLTVMVEARQGTIFTAPILAKIFRLTELVDALPGVNHDQVTSIAHRSTRWARALAGGVIASDPIMLWPLVTDAEARQIRRLVLESFAFGSMVSLDERAAVIRAGFHEHRLDYRRLFDTVNARILPLADGQVTISVSGQPRLMGWIFRLERQMFTAFAAAIVVTWLCLYVYFRDWRGALRPTISGGLAALWGMGLLWLTGFALNPLTLLVPFLIAARAVSHSAQMHDRYYEELARGALKTDAIQGAFVGLFAATLSSIVTDALGVLAIGIVGIPALRQLAVAATVWLLSLIGTELLLNPIIYNTLRAPDPGLIRARRERWFDQGVARLADAVLGPRGRWLVLVGGAAVLVVSLALLPALQIGEAGSASRILEPDAEYNRDHRLVQERFGGNEPFMVVVEGTRRDALQQAFVLRTIERFQRTLERHPAVGGSVSLVDILKSMGQLFHEGEPKWGMIPTSDAEIRGMFFTYWATVFPSTSAQYFSPDFRTAPVTFYCRDHTAEHVRSLVGAARGFIDAHPMEDAHFRLAGGFIGVMAAIYDEILRTEGLMTLAAFLVMFLAMAATYRSVVAALLLTTPVAFANLVVNAYMAARGIGLDLNTLPVIAVGVGFGIDYGVYIVSRAREAARGGAGLEDALREGLTGAGRTVAFTALTLVAGTLCFTLTELRFASEMAALLILWMLVSAASALVLLPALVLVVRPRFLVETAP